MPSAPLCVVFMVEYWRQRFCHRAEGGLSLDVFALIQHAGAIGSQLSDTWREARVLPSTSPTGSTCGGGWQRQAQPGAFLGELMHGQPSSGEG